MDNFILNSDQIGICLINVPTNIKSKIIKLIESKGFEKSFCVGDNYVSINFKLKLWFTHQTNEYYPDLPIKKAHFSALSCFLISSEADQPNKKD